MRTSNPTLSDKAFYGLENSGGRAMTVAGTINKCFLLLALATASAGFTWHKFAATGHDGDVMLWTGAGAITGFIIAIITIFAKKASPFTAPLYALAQGLFIGGISAIMEAQYPGIVVQAGALTFGTLGALLFAYRSGVIKVTQKFRAGVFAATGAIMLVYLASFIMSFFGMRFSFLHDSSLLSIGISAVVVIVAALNLVLDFDFIDRGAQSNLPKYMEWYGAFGLMVTLVWLYLEILRLLAKLRGR